MASVERRTKVAVANDYELIVAGVTNLLAAYADRIEVVDQLLVGDPIVDSRVDVVLYDTYGRGGIARDAIEGLLGHGNVAHLAIFSLDLSEALVADARDAGATGFISKALGGDDIADAIVRVAQGEVVLAIHPDAATSEVEAIDELDWPGRSDGLTERESQVLVLLAEGLTNAEIATALYLGVETIKTHVRKLLAKLSLRNRVEAAAYAHRTGAFVRYQPVDPDATAVDD